MNKGDTDAWAELKYPQKYRFTGFSAKVAEPGWRNRDPSSITAKWTDSNGRAQELTVTPQWTDGWQDSEIWDLPNIDIDTIRFEFGYSGGDRFTALGQIKMYGPDLDDQAWAMIEVDTNAVDKLYRWVYNEPAGGSNFDRAGRDCLKTVTITTHSGYVASVKDSDVPNAECC